MIYELLFMMVLLIPVFITIWVEDSRLEKRHKEINKYIKDGTPHIPYCSE